MIEKITVYTEDQKKARPFTEAELMDAKKPDVDKRKLAIYNCLLDYHHDQASIGETVDRLYFLLWEIN